VKQLAKLISNSLLLMLLFGMILLPSVSSGILRVAKQTNNSAESDEPSVVLSAHDSRKAVVRVIEPETIQSSQSSNAEVTPTPVNNK
jgi:hypothetical protein